MEEAKATLAADVMFASTAVMTEALIVHTYEREEEGVCQDMR